MAWNWPWLKSRADKIVPERKNAGGSGFVAIHAQGEARWTRRDYVALAREGYMRNPVVHRSVRLIAEAAAAVPWLLYVGATEYDDHPALELLARPNHRQAGGTFLEALRQSVAGGKRLCRADRPFDKLRIRRFGSFDRLRIRPVGRLPFDKLRVA